MKTIILKSGKVESLYDENDFIYLLEEEMGLNVRRWFEDWLKDWSNKHSRTIADLENQVNDLEYQVNELESEVEALESELEQNKKTPL